MEPKADIAVAGLAVMGENLVLNMESRGFTVACYNRTAARLDAFLSGRGRGRTLIGCRSLGEVAAHLKRPRKIMMMVRAGQAVDELINAAAPHLEPGDILIDGGNSHFSDTLRRSVAAGEKGLLYVGAGV